MSHEEGKPETPAMYRFIGETPVRLLIDAPIEGGHVQLMQPSGALGKVHWMLLLRTMVEPQDLRATLRSIRSNPDAEEAFDKQRRPGVEMPGRPPKEEIR